MTQFDIITIFPEIFDSYFKESIIKRAQKKRLIKIQIHNLRDFTNDAHKTVDDKPYGGGPGMILKVDVIFKAVKSIVAKNKKIKSKERKIIFLSAKGKKFDQKMAGRKSKLKQIILICGRYEGIDERVAKYIADEEISIGDYVLTGGEIPAMIIVDAVSRLIPGVIKKDSLKEESFSAGLKEYPQYTRPEVFEPGRNKIDWGTCPPNFRRVKVWRVPKILLSGHHKKIKEWQQKHTKKIEKK
jgi:tRNA (guanine37-N1)-methyltransferase